MTLLDLTGNIQDFADTAALMQNLDLVISVCTSTAHLAGALGKPVWLLNRFDTDWRWFLDREDSPWYPTMRIFRQPKPGDWVSVVQNVVTALREFVAP
jgi:ADP-heptose:LPS heptosyltransferase